MRCASGRVLTTARGQSVEAKSRSPPPPPPATHPLGRVGLCRLHFGDVVPLSEMGVFCTGLLNTDNAMERVCYGAAAMLLGQVRALFLSKAPTCVGGGGAGFGAAGGGRVLRGGGLVGGITTVLWRSQVHAPPPIPPPYPTPWVPAPGGFCHG